MSGVYIPGLSMPRKTGIISIVLSGDGSALLCEDGVYSEIKAIPVPDHGRCVDADAAKEFLKPVDSIRNYEPEWTWGELYESDCNAIDKLPTILPADVPDTNVGKKKEDE